MHGKRSIFCGDPESIGAALSIGICCLVVCLVKFSKCVFVIELNCLCKLFVLVDFNYLVTALIHICFL